MRMKLAKNPTICSLPLRCQKVWHHFYLYSWEPTAAITVVAAVNATTTVILRLSVKQKNKGETRLSSHGS